MRSTDRVSPEMSGDRFKTETLFAADDTSAVDAFHAGTKWGRTLDRRLSVRIRAFLQHSALREVVSRSRKEHHEAESVALPDTELGALSLQEAIERRRSLDGSAEPLPEPIGIEDLASILKYSYGVICGQPSVDVGSVQQLRACPSAGALYPLEIYPVVMDVAGLEPGIYHYNVADHALSLLRRENARETMPGFEFQPGLRKQASVVFVVTAVLLRSMAKYLDRGYRFVMNEAGALSQNLYLTTVARGLSGCAWGGFCDEDVANCVGADGTREVVVLGFIVGKRTTIRTALT